MARITWMFWLWRRIYWYDTTTRPTSCVPHSGCSGTGQVANDLLTSTTGQRLTTVNTCRLLTSMIDWICFPSRQRTLPTRFNCLLTWSYRPTETDSASFGRSRNCGRNQRRVYGRNRTLGQMARLSFGRNRSRSRNSKAKWVSECVGFNVPLDT